MVQAHPGTNSFLAYGSIVENRDVYVKVNLLLEAFFIAFDEHYVRFAYVNVL